MACEFWGLPERDYELYKILLINDKIDVECLLEEKKNLVMYVAETLLKSQCDNQENILAVLYLGRSRPLNVETKTFESKIFQEKFLEAAEFRAKNEL